MDIDGTPFQLAYDGTTNLSGFDSNDSNLITTTPLAAVYLDPFAVGGRFAVMASMFQKYKILGGTLTYVPRMLSGAIALAYSVGAAQSSQDVVGFAMGWHPDPVQLPTDFADAVRFGGKICNLSKTASVKVGASPWLFTSTTSASPTNVDLRQCSFGGIYCFLDNTMIIPGGAFIVPGNFSLSLRVAFKGAQDGPVLGRGAGILEMFQQSAVEQQNRMSIGASRVVANSVHHRPHAGMGEETKEVCQPHLAVPLPAEFVPPGELAIARLSGDVKENTSLKIQEDPLNFDLAEVVTPAQNVRSNRNAYTSADLKAIRLASLPPLSVLRTGGKLTRG
jgi:hypothetical protein